MDSLSLEFIKKYTMRTVISISDNIPSGFVLSIFIILAIQSWKLPKALREADGLTQEFSNALVVICLLEYLTFFFFSVSNNIILRVISLTVNLFITILVALVSIGVLNWLITFKELDILTIPGLVVIVGALIATGYPIYSIYSIYVTVHRPI